MRVARWLLSCGFETWRDLPGANPISLRADVALLPADKALVGRALALAESMYSEEVGARRLSLPVSSAAYSADAVACHLDIHSAGGGLASSQRLYAELGIGNVGSGTPRDGIRVLASVVQDGTPIDRLTGVAVQAAMVQAAPKSLPQIASGLRCWHRFAVDVLNMPADVTLPPKDDSHVILLVYLPERGDMQ